MTGWKLNFYFRSVVLTKCFFWLFLSSQIFYLCESLHVSIFLKAVLSHCLSRLCWPFSVLPAVGGFLGKCYIALTPTTPVWLYRGGAHGKDMTMPLGMISGIHRAMRNVFFLSTSKTCHSEAWVSTTAAAPLLWLPKFKVCTPLCFFPSLSSMCVYSKAFLMDIFPTNTSEDWQLKGCLGFWVMLLWAWPYSPVVKTAVHCV